MASAFSVRGSPLQLISRLSPLSQFTRPSKLASQCFRSQRLAPLSTSSALPAKGSSSKMPSPKQQSAGGRGAKSKRNRPVERDPKLVSMLKQLQLLSPKRLPPPLRMGRNRYLRHWTIHRAWLLFRRKERERREGDLKRQFQGMQAACEELRLTEGPGTREEGYLYRVAMEKKGVYGHHGIPIEYARAQTETPAREAWNHDWKRSS